MENGMTIEETRTFCLEGLEILNWYYDEINKRNKIAYDKHLKNAGNREDSFEFLTKIQYAFSFAFKAFMVAIDQGHFVDFETYKNFKKRKLEKNNLGFNFSAYIMNLCNKMPQAIKNTYNLISKDDIALLKYYKTIMSNSESKNVIKPFILGILECDANLPFSRKDWDRYFYVGENVVTRDNGDFNFNTRFRNLFSEHKLKISNSNSDVKTR